MIGQEHHRRKKARDLLSRSGYRSGGHLQTARDDHAEDKAMIREAFHEHDEQLHHGKKTRLRLADGGMAMGDQPASRPDRSSRGKKGKAHTNINIVMAPGQSGQQPPQRVPVPVPVPARPPMGAGAPPIPPGGGMPPGGPPPRPPGPPMPPPGLAGGPPGGMPPGGLPMRKAGGRSHRDSGGPTTSNQYNQAQSSSLQNLIDEENAAGSKSRKLGGRAPMAHLRAGAGSGVGRLEHSKEAGHDKERLARGGKPDEWCEGGRA